MYKCKYDEAKQKKNYSKTKTDKKINILSKSDKEIYHFRARPFK